VTVFLDANVLFSACYKQGGIHALIMMMQSRGLTLCTDQRAYEEAFVNLTLKRPLGLSALERLATSIDVRPSVPQRSAFMHTLRLPHGDALVFAAAVSCGATVFLTGDRQHFGQYYGQTIDGVTILSPAQMIDRL
jgi:predicted nucleic acid-binding protein